MYMYQLEVSGSSVVVGKGGMIFGKAYYYW